ncbi:MAG: hypothetical protein HKN47_03880 [Pirellulaceae bacterium]|nr:hypothetical protein [Pirellulaceae bacterium]
MTVSSAAWPSRSMPSMYIDRKSLGMLLVMVVGALANHHESHGQSLLYAASTPPDRAAQLRNQRWIETIEREVPPLKHETGDRLPMIMWHGVGFDSLSQREIDVLRQRGLVQHLQMDVAMIPAARALQSAGVPVILMQGRTDNWPYSLAKNGDDWAHQFDLSYQPTWFGKEDAFEWHGACPNQIAGWSVLQQQTRQTMQAFRDAGVDIAGVWMDYEGDPYPWSHLFDQLQHCRRCRAELPPNIVQDKNAWRTFAWQRYVELYDQHFAKPIREVYPDSLVTNWHVVFSTADDPVRYFVRDILLPPLSPRHFSATNPIAYGSDLVWHERSKTTDAATQNSVDLFYSNEILQQVRTDLVNRRALGKQNVKSIPWVARVCKIDTSDRKAPVMTRESYRRALVQLWQYDIATMQIFNPLHDGSEELAITEIQDAVLAYDEFLGQQSNAANN